MISIETAHTIIEERSRRVKWQREQARAYEPDSIAIERRLRPGQEDSIWRQAY